MFLASKLIDLLCMVSGPRFAHEVFLHRLERWRSFEPEYFFLHLLADPVRAAIDVGANEGIYAGRLSQLCRSVHCFEPNPRLAAQLRIKLRRSVIVHEVAASNERGVGELRVPYSGETEMHGTATIAKENLLDSATTVQCYQCRLERLDDVISEPVGFIKIDVEGHELAVLEGAVKILKRDRPVLLIESEKRHHSEAPENIFNFMANHHYVGFFLEDYRLRSTSAFIPDSHQNSATLRAGVRKIGLYVNNFIFVPGRYLAGLKSALSPQALRELTKTSDAIEDSVRPGPPRGL